MGKVAKTSSVKVKEAKKGKAKPTSPVAGAPKRALTAYFLWLKAERPNIAKDGMSVTDVTKKAGEIWRGMSAGAKKKWEEAAVKDKARYQAELKAFQG